jgi:hypothetical protein
MEAVQKSTAKQRRAGTFDMLMDMCRNNAMASGNACNPIIFEPMVISIPLAQKKLLMELEYKLNEVRWQKICDQENKKEAEGKQ